MPIVGLYGQLALFNGGTNDPNAFLARYVPLPGSTLINNQVGMYPFADQYVAANAIIVQPLTLSMLMIAPVNQPGGYSQKQSFFTSLQNALYQHSVKGGTFNVATPAYLYQNLIMTGMTDVTHGETQQQQIQWQLDFIQPLLTLAGTTAAQNNTFSKVSSGASFPPGPIGWSGNPQAQNPSITGGLSSALGVSGPPISSPGGGHS
jgi:hypothetical protein